MEVGEEVEIQMVWWFRCIIDRFSGMGALYSNRELHSCVVIMVLVVSGDGIYCCGSIC